MNHIDHLPLSCLRESPFNPRKVYSEASLQELADSIRSQGILQPIVVRPLGDFQVDIEFRYEIVFGHRRTRAARIAGVEQVPCIINELSDAAAAIAQVHENLQREDVSPLEEADSFQHLKATHDMNADAIAKAVGKSRAYVYARLKLATAAPEVRAALTEQGLSPEIGLQLARLPHHDLQRMALKRMRNTYEETTERPIVWASVRSATSTIKSMFQTDLDDAEFDLADPKLHKFAGACTTCPRRAGNIADLGDMLAPSICTDDRCFERKTEAFRQQEIARLKKAGHTVLQGEEAREAMPHSWSPPDGFNRITTVVGYTEDGNDRKSVLVSDVLRAMGDAAPKTMVVVNPGGALIHFASEKDLRPGLIQLGLVGEADDDDLSTPSNAGASQYQGMGATRLPTPAHRAVSLHWVGKIAPLCLAAAAERESRTTFELRMICRTLMQDRDSLPSEISTAMGWQEQIDLEGGGECEADEAWTFSRLEVATADELARFATLCALSFAPCTYGEPGLEEKLAIAAEYGIDVVAAAAEDKKDEPADAGAPANADLFEGMAHRA